MNIDLSSFIAGIVIGSLVTYRFWRFALERAVGEILAGKRTWRIGGRRFTIVECK